MSETIVSNNCIVGNMLHDLGLRFNSPTINLQIMPMEFPKFCQNFRHYMETELIEYKKLSDLHRYQLINMFGRVPYEFPFGLCDDVIVVFQHYSSFEEGKKAWDRRKKRIDYDHVGYMFYVAWEYDRNHAQKFYELGLDNAVIFTERFDVDFPHYRIDPPAGSTYLDVAADGKKYYAQDFNPTAFVNQVRGT